MALAAVVQALGEAPDQRNDKDRVYIFKLKDSALLWITYGQNGSIANCVVALKSGSRENIALP